MNYLTKISSVILALFLALCFAACKSGGPSEVASFKGDDPGQGDTITIGKAYKDMILAGFSLTRIKD